MPQTPPEPVSTPVREAETPFDPATASRYSRQVLFSGIGLHGQQRLATARVAIIGVGATGASAASLLARAGVSYLRLVDRDFVEPSNLQRQILFDEADADAVLPKAEAARRKLALSNSDILVEAAINDLTPGNADLLLGGVHLILDCTDNFETRYLINDFAVLHGVPWIYSAAVGAYAATMNILPRLPPESDNRGKDSHPGELPADPQQDAPYTPTACLACIFPEPPSGHIATCDTAGILGSAVTLAASIQCAEALKLLTGQAHLLRRTLISVDLWPPAGNGHLHRAELNTSTPHPACRVCGDRDFRFLRGDQQPQITLCGRNAVQIHERRRPIALPAMHARLTTLPDVTDLRSNEMLLRFRRGEQTVTLFADGRAVIQGTTDPRLARSLYARFIGA